MGLETGMSILTIAYIFFILISIGVGVVLWLALPFSVFGMKDLISESILEQKKTNELLRSMLTDVPAGGGEADEAPQVRDKSEAL